MITLPPSIIAQQEESVETIGSLRASLAEANRKGHAADALLTGSRIEDWLKAALKLHLPHSNSDLRDKLFGLKGPLTTFEAKADMAKALGVISAETHGVLNVIRDIRNKFAHPKESIDFDSPVLDEFFKKLKAAEGKPRSTIFFQSAVDCINDIRARMQPRTLGQALRASTKSSKK